MHLAYIVAEFPSLTETFVLREIEALQRRGVTVTVFALRRAAAGVPVHASAAAWVPQVRYAPRVLTAAVVLASLSRLRGSPRRCLRSFGAALRGCGRHPRRALAALWHSAVATAWAAEGERLGIEHVHAEFAFVTADVARTMAAWLGRRFSVSAHAWDVYAQPPAELARHLEGCAFVTACTQAARQHLDAVLPVPFRERLHLIRHGLDFGSPRVPDGGPSNAGLPLVLGVGRIEEKKGFCYLLDACDLLRERGVTFRCVIAGDGSLLGRLAAMATTLDLGGCVEFTGRLNQEQLAGLYRQAAVFVLPSVVARDGDRDGLPNTVLEAMDAGLPVVTTRAAAASEAIADGESGFLVPPHDTEALADRIESLLRSPQLRRTVGGAARRRVREAFDIDRNVESLIRLFEDSIGAK
ncbi:MAG: Alpha-D-kanosaminyltransferase [Lentisphaerae bacterium ADurb.BinA184]|nr:MAG: Alpha-D-kanosaminyltransferase [Lentisphaerae bacterium ADurb.BinA184]